MHRSESKYTFGLQMRVCILYSMSTHFTIKLCCKANGRKNPFGTYIPYRYVSFTKYIHLGFTAHYEGEFRLKTPMILLSASNEASRQLPGGTVLYRYTNSSKIFFGEKISRVASLLKLEIAGPTVSQR